MTDLHNAREAVCEQIDALLALDATGSLVPHGIGGLARELLERSAKLLRSLPAAPVASSALRANELAALERMTPERYEGSWAQMALDIDIVVAALRRLAPASGLGWIAVSERLPEDNVTVLVYTPDRGDGEGDNISFDACHDGGWVCHDESYEHFMAVGGPNAAGPDAICTGPAVEAPYTHWQPLPAAPIAAPASKEGETL